MIPKVLHRIWVGGEMPQIYKQFEKDWRRLHPDWEIKTWGDNDFGWLRNQDLFDHPEKYVAADAVGQFRSDVARYEILAKFGGVYADCDVEPVKSFDNLLDVEAFASWEENGVYVGNTVIGSVPGAQFWQKMIDRVGNSAKANAGRAATWVSGPRVLTFLHFENPTGLTVYPQSFFFPYSYKDLKTANDPALREYLDCYAIHHWGHQRDKRGKALVRKVEGRPTLSVAIMAHASREKWVPDLEAQLGNVKTVWDRMNDRWDTGARALVAYDPNCTHHLVVQDDALLPPDFLEGVKKMLEYIPYPSPVGLYYGRVRPRETHTRMLVQRAKQQNASFIRHGGPWWGVGIIIPTANIPEIVKWGDSRPDIPNYDRRISRWYQENDIECYYPVPSLIEHRHGDENPSLVPGRTGINRRAWQFVGPRSALDVDWSGPVIGA